MTFEARASFVALVSIAWAAAQLDVVALEREERVDLGVGEHRGGGVDVAEKEADLGVVTS
jgi:hypothetical protein